MTAAIGDTLDRITPTRRPNDRVVMRQDWLDLLFLHWEVDAEALQKMLPPGLTLDTWEGKAYVGLVPFTMRNVRPVWSPSVPGVSHFHECNIRTYVHYEGRDPGVWFFSLDAANPLAVALARSLWKLPYFVARMALKKEGTGIQYATERVLPGPTPAACHVSYTLTGTPAASTPGTLEHFLAERYILYAYAGGRLLSGQVYHTPYPLQTAQVSDLKENIVSAMGITVPEAAPLAHYASGVTVEVFPLRPVVSQHPLSKSDKIR
jgi:uncharacterized protein YqjF (DUF2071 family)